jgi:hypothetical protein
MLGVGLLGGAAFMDTSVPTPHGAERVHNIGRLNLQVCLCTAGCALIVCAVLASCAHVIVNRVGAYVRRVDSKFESRWPPDNALRNESARTSSTHDTEHLV